MTRIGFLLLTLAQAAPATEPAPRAVAGKVADRQGRPVADAEVFQTGDRGPRTEVRTGPDGRFTLPGVAEGRAFVIAKKPGFRFQGRLVGADPGEIALTMTRTDEAPDRRLETPPALGAEEEIALARRVLAPYADRVVKDGSEAEKVRTLEAMARVDPARALEAIEGGTLKEPYLKSMIRMRVGEALMDEAPDEAVAIFESLDDPSFRAGGLLRAALELPATERAKKLDLLDRALVSARAAREPTGLRTLLMGQVAEAWLDLGLVDRATALLREGEKEAAALPVAAWGGYARGAFAEELVQIDVKAGLALVEGLTDAREVDRHHGNIAHELARRDPAEAERELGKVNVRSQRDNYAARVVYRMAAADLGRARRVAASIEDAPLRGFGLGMMALGLAGSDRAAAEALLSEAFAVLEQATGDDATVRRGIHQPVWIGAALLSTAERIDPALVLETLWRTLALRRPDRQADHLSPDDVRASLMIARYDRVVALALLDPLPRPGEPDPNTAEAGLLPVALALIDPRRVVELVEAMPEDSDLKLQSPKNAARLGVASLLARRGERRWKYLQSRRLYLWVPDVEDIVDPF